MIERVPDEFVCEQCGNIDNIFFTHILPGTGYTCCRCRTGQWHNQMQEEKYDPDVHGDKSYLNRPALRENPFTYNG